MDTLVKTKNNYDFVDYKTPIIPGQNDMRTASYKGHNYYIAPDKYKPKSIENVCEILQRKEMCYNYQTESAAQYQWKYLTSKADNAARAISCSRPQFVKQSQQRFISKPPKKIDQYNTIYHKDFDCKYPDLESKLHYDHTTQEPEKLKHVVYANSQGFQKYLDIFMTTNIQDFVPHSYDKQYGIARKDNITIWDWLEYPKSKKGFGLKEYPMPTKERVEPVNDKLLFKKPVLDRVVPNKPKFISTGFTTENRSNFTIPLPLKFEVNIDEINPLVIPPTGIITPKTEYSVYGSGTKTHLVIDSRGSCPEITDV